VQLLFVGNAKRQNVWGWWTFAGTANISHKLCHVLRNICRRCEICLDVGGWLVHCQTDSQPPVTLHREYSGQCRGLWPLS
jgi:hypothetical protein